MRFRTRLLLMLTGTVVLPVVMLSVLVRNNMATRLQTQNSDGLNARVFMVQNRLQDYAARTNTRLENLVFLIQNDHQLRASLTAYDGRISSIDPYLIDFGEHHARLSGLSYFQLLDENGVILSSGHFRNEFGRKENNNRNFRNAMSGVQSKPALITGRTPEHPVFALARPDSVFIGGKPYYLLAGFILDQALLSDLNPTSNVVLCLEGIPDALVSHLRTLYSCELSLSEITDPGLTPASDLVFFDNTAGVTSRVRFVLVHSLTDLNQLFADLDKWFIGILGFVLTLGLFSIIWASRKISEPLSDLLHKTTRIDLNRLNVSFKTGRSDEIGDLSRVLDELTRRLKRDAASLREAERRLAIGELARQVNHDIKNALTPIRNIVRHYSTLAHSDPDELVEVVRDREASLDASIDYLEQLASNYAKLTPDFQLSAVNLDQLVADIVREYTEARGVRIELRLSAQCTVDTDPIAFRRILDNVLDNAFDSLPGRSGKVTISTKIIVDSKTERKKPPQVRGNAGEEIRAQLVISDTGTGMNPTEIENAFKDFHTSKDGGTGLGLSIVRRLVMDLGGSVRLDSAKDKGTRVTLDIPARRQ